MTKYVKKLTQWETTDITPIMLFKLTKQETKYRMYVHLVCLSVPESQLCCLRRYQESSDVGSARCMLSASAIRRLESQHEAILHSVITRTPGTQQYVCNVEKGNNLHSY